VLGVYYVWLLNVNANSGYAARQLEIERKALEIEKNLLRVSVAEQESLEELFSHIDGMTVIDDDEVTYFVMDAQ